MAVWFVCVGCDGEGLIMCWRCYGSGVDPENDGDCAFCDGSSTEFCDICEGEGGYYAEGENEQ
ncbi:hypothetical protein LCGC14_3144110 [marine sediment metagenome]|uniref:Uncharacterized protein n=1 Tax=marine sediment metagenome TaxID=412755 RepID=A0A0F8VW48_9ZZZZ